MMDRLKVDKRIVKSFVWSSLALDASETWIMTDKKRLEAFETLI